MNGQTGERGQTNERTDRRRTNERTHEWPRIPGNEYHYCCQSQVASTSAREGLVFFKMAENRSGENDAEKPSQNIELTETDQAAKPTDEKTNTSEAPKETKNKSMRFNLSLLNC